MFIAAIRFRIAPPKREILLERLNAMAKRAGELSGCLECSVFEAIDHDSRTILLLERWESRDAMDRHVGTGVCLDVLNRIHPEVDPPEVLLYEVSAERGLDLIRELRE